MREISRQHSWFELCFIAGLILAASHKSFHISPALIISIGQTVFLVSIYLLLRILARRVHEYLGRLVFAITTLLLITELLIQYYTGLHLNRFILSVFLQQDAASNIGISFHALILIIALVVAVAWYGNKFLHRFSYRLNARILLALLLIGGTSAQLTYAVMFYQGDQYAIKTSRSLPFFFVPHHYYIIKALGPILGKRQVNPFADTMYKAGHDSPLKAAPKIIHQQKNSQNLLILIMDSLRAKDIKANPALAPHMMELGAGATGFLDLNHYSVSNCTHFSFYTMFTGKLPTSFGSARRAGFAPSFLRDAAASGFTVSSSETQKLSWYDLDTILFPAEMKRTIAPKSVNDKDHFIEDDTLKTIASYAKTKEPFVHLAYFDDSHYPYGSGSDEINTSVAENYKLYLGTITDFDAKVATIIAALDKTGLAKNTTVIVTSDHGESFNEHGLTGHSSSLSSEQTTVPFLVIGRSDLALKRVKSHKDMYALSEAVLAGTDAASFPTHKEEPVILANCSYEYPTGFSVVSKEGRIDFSYDDGYLTPLKADSKHMLPASTGAWLLSQIKESDQQ